MKFYSKGFTLLDVGCGNGEYLYLAKKIGYNVIGLDLLENRLQRASRFSKNIIQGDARNIPFKDDFFEVILCSEVLEHVSNQQKVISEISRVSKLNGRLVLSVPTHGLWRLLTTMFGKKMFLSDEHLREYSILPIRFHFRLQNLMELLKKFKFKVEKIEGAFLLDLPFSQRIAALPYASKTFNLVENIGKTSLLKFFSRYVILICIKVM